MERIKLDYISSAVAELINKILSSKGIPAEDKVIVATPIGETKVGSIIIPGTVDESRPKKGVIVQHGSISEAYQRQEYLFNIGNIITYGLYSGKEIQFDADEFPKEVQKELENTKFTILSLSEIAYVEVNPK